MYKLHFVNLYKVIHTASLIGWIHPILRLQCIVSVHCREEGCIGKYTPRGPRDFPRAGILHPEAQEIARGRSPRAISRAEGCKIPTRGKSRGPRWMYFPMHPSSRQCTDTISYHIKKYIPILKVQWILRVLKSILPWYWWENARYCLPGCNHPTTWLNVLCTNYVFNMPLNNCPHTSIASTQLLAKPSARGRPTLARASLPPSPALPYSIITLPHHPHPAAPSHWVITSPFHCSTLACTLHIAPHLLNSLQVSAASSEPLPSLSLAPSPSACKPGRKTNKDICH